MTKEHNKNRTNCYATASQAQIVAAGSNRPFCLQLNTFLLIPPPPHTICYLNAFSHVGWDGSLATLQQLAYS